MKREPLDDEASTRDNNKLVPGGLFSRRRRRVMFDRLCNYVQLFRAAIPIIITLPNAVIIHHLLYITSGERAGRALSDELKIESAKMEQSLVNLAFVAPRALGGAGREW